MARILTTDNVNIAIGIVAIIITILIALIQATHKVIMIRRSINDSLNSGINYRLNNNLEDAKKEFNKALEYEHHRLFNKLIIRVKINLYETYHYDMIQREESLNYARANEENLLKGLPNYQNKNNLLFSKYKYQYAILCCNLGYVYNELALIREAKNNYEISKKFSLQAIDIFRKISKLNDFYFSTYATTYSNLAIAYRGLANLYKDSSLLQLALNNAKKSLSIYEEMKDSINIARLQNNIGNIYNDLIRYKNNENDRENAYNNSENYFCKSLELYNIEKYPYEFARSHQNLGSLNLLMLRFSDNNDMMYSYFIKAEKSYEMCKKVYVKDKYENAYIILQYNFMTLYFQALKRFNDKSLLPKIVDCSNLILEVCTIENMPKIYIDTNYIMADAYKFVIETFQFDTENEVIDMIIATIAKYEIVLGFKELSLKNKTNTITNLIKLNIILFDITGLDIYEEKCNNYGKELQKIIQEYPEDLNTFADEFGDKRYLFA